jgi:hypothetical protein
MDTQPDETLKLSDGTVSLYRNVKFMVGATEVAVADHMNVQHVTGNEDDVVILTENGNPTVKRLVQQLEFSVPPPAVGGSSSRGGFSFAPLPADEVTRLLAIYRMFKAA